MIDVNSETWRTISEWAAQKAGHCTQSIIGLNTDEKTTQQQRGYLGALAALMNLPEDAKRESRRHSMVRDDD